MKWFTLIQVEYIISGATYCYPHKKIWNTKLKFCSVPNFCMIDYNFYIYFLRLFYDSDWKTEGKLRASLSHGRIYCYSIESTYSVFMNLWCNDLLITHIHLLELINSFYATGFFLYTLKISENQAFSDIFMGYRKRPLA